MTKRDICLKYLIESGFVDNYVKKLMFPSDIDDLYDDFKQEVYLALCEVKEGKWEQLYNARPNKDPFYDVRNWTSVLIRNTVRSTSSYAYKKLKKNRDIERMQDSVKWEVLSNTIADETEDWNE